MKDKVSGMLGLAERAGKLISGETKVLDAIRSGKAELVILATDASDNTKKMFHDKCSSYGIPYYEHGVKSDFGHTDMAVSDKNFSEAIRRLLG